MRKVVGHKNGHVMTRWQYRDYVIKTFREELQRGIYADRYTRAVRGFKYLIIEFLEPPNFLIKGVCIIIRHFTTA